MEKLFCDCKTDAEKSAFFLSGRAVETGVIASAIYQADHRKGDPVMVCRDHGVHAYRFLDLVMGQQLEAKP